MSAAQPDLRSSINDVLSGSASTEQYKRVHEALTDGYGLPTTVVGRNGMTGVPTSAIKRKFADDPEYVKERYGNANPFLAAAMAGREYEAGAHGDTETTRAIDAMLGDESEQTRAFLTERDVEPDEFRALIDETVIGDAAPIEVDPVIVDVQRSAAPELDVIQSVAQSGFQAQFNVINNRDITVGFLSETEAAGDLESQFNPQDFDLPTEFAELTRLIQNTGMTYDRARIMVSPFFYNAVYEEVTPTIRLDGYDADVEYGPQGIALSTEQGSAPITPAPNIRDYGGLSGVGATGGVGDAFIVDELALQFRQLAPMSTVPLGRTGLADRVALFEYYTLVDKSQGDHLRWLQNYDIPTA